MNPLNPLLFTCDVPGCGAFYRNSTNLQATPQGRLTPQQSSETVSESGLYDIQTATNNNNTILSSSDVNASKEHCSKSESSVDEDSDDSATSEDFDMFEADANACLYTLLGATADMFLSISLVDCGRKGENKAAIFCCISAGQHCYLPPLALSTPRDQRNRSPDRAYPSSGGWSQMNGYKAEDVDDPVSPSSQASGSKLSPLLEAEGDKQGLQRLQLHPFRVIDNKTGHVRYSCPCCDSSYASSSGIKYHLTSSHITALDMTMISGRWFLNPQKLQVYVNAQPSARSSDYNEEAAEYNSSDASVSGLEDADVAGRSDGTTPETKVEDSKDTGFEVAGNSNSKQSVIISPTNPTGDIFT
ncbi:hypothetical protein HDV05_008044, partial [Chytridiales sp. JEL 0842]